MNDESVRAALAYALQGSSNLGCEDFDPFDLDSGCPDCGDLLRVVDALLPVVREIAAEELRCAYVEDRTTVEKMTPFERLTCFVVKMEDLVIRVDALTNPEASPDV